MNFAVNKIRYNKSAIHFLAKESKKKYNNVSKRQFSFQNASSNPNQDPNQDPNQFPSWKLIAILSGLGLYHHYQRVYK
jgi:hypothetical protein